MFMKGESEFFKYGLCFGRIGFGGYSLLAQEADLIFEARIHEKRSASFYARTAEVFDTTRTVDAVRSSPRLGSVCATITKKTVAKGLLARV